MVNLRTPTRGQYRLKTILSLLTTLMQLVRNDNSLTPIARYRRAKIGIVSRSRRAFLEIFPAGVNIVDFVVVTFVSFAKHTSATKEPLHSPA